MRSHEEASVCAISTWFADYVTQCRVSTVLLANSRKVRRSRIGRVYVIGKPQTTLCLKKRPTFKLSLTLSNLEISNFQRFGRSTGSNCVHVPNFVEIAQNAAMIWQFFNFSRWRPSAILDFQTLEISTSDPIRRPNMRHRTKFREDRSNRSGDMANFRFFKMAAAAILDFGKFKF